MKSRPGTYALILKVNAPFEISVGKLGSLSGEKGFYIYCGSAFGPGGVKARTTHHAGQSQRPHWHIDYLRPIAMISEIWYSYDPVKREHDWTNALLDDQQISLPFIGFGSSDCSCRSHLLFSNQHPSFHRFVRKIHTQFADHKTISRFGNESDFSLKAGQRVTRKSTPGN